MTFTAESQPGKRRGRARNVTSYEADAALNQLRALADAGNVDALAAIVSLASRHRREPAAA